MREKHTIFDASRQNRRRRIAGYIQGARNRIARYLYSYVRAKWGFKEFLYNQRVPGVWNKRCACDQAEMSVRHVLVVCPRWERIREEEIGAAGKMNQRALEGRERFLGKRHRDTLESLSNLVVQLRHQYCRAGQEIAKKAHYDAAQQRPQIEHEDRQRAWLRHPFQPTDLVSGCDPSWACNSWACVSRACTSWAWTSQACTS